MQNRIYIGIMVLLLSVTMIFITVMLLLYVTGEGWAQPTGSKMVIDHDGGADDAMAIFIALLNEKYFNGPQVISISTTFGNVNESQAFINTQRILRLANRTDRSWLLNAPTEWQRTFTKIHDSIVLIITRNVAREELGHENLFVACGPFLIHFRKETSQIAQSVKQSIPIYRGSTGPFINGIETDHYYGYDGLGDNPYEYFELTKPEPEHAAVGLIELSKLYEGNLTVIATGSMTNIAQAIQLDPSFISRLDHLYVGAGTIHSKEHPRAEFNAAMDPEAYYIITKHATPDKVTVVPFSQVQKYLNTTKKWRESVLGSIPTSIMEAMNDFERKSLAVSSDWSQLDPAVMGIALHKNMIDVMTYSKNGIILCGNERGITINKFTNTTEDANVKLFYSAARESYKVMGSKYKPSESGAKPIKEHND